jgi:hypothetical protein
LRITGNESEMQLNPLYNQYSAGQKHPEVFNRKFNAGAIDISIRPFFIPDDFHLYNEWINEEINAGKNGKQTRFYFSENYFKTILESSNAQSLWGLINGEPAFQLDLYKAIHYHTPDQVSNISLLPGDVMIQLVIAPRIAIDKPAASFILPACLQYLAIRSDRVFFTTDKDNFFYNKLAESGSPVLKLVAKNRKIVYVYLLNND